MSEKLWCSLAPLLLPPSWLYRAGIYLRNLAYSSGYARITRLPVPVISVGNLSAGGTGKTPVTLSLANILQSEPYQAVPAIVSRGYHRKSSGYQLVSSGDGPLIDQLQSGDEPQIYANRLKHIPVAVDENRVRAGQTILRHFSLSTIVLDDAFQHRRLHRDLDIVLVDSDNSLYTERLLPAGYLREPITSLHRADLIVVTRFDANNAGKNSLFESLSHQFGAEKMLTCRTRTSRCYHLRDLKLMTLENLSKLVLLPFCGLARPEGFLNSVRQLGCQAPCLIRFPDHHQYHVRDVQRLAEAYTKSGVDYLITTEKDAVKLGGLFQALPILVLEIDIEWLSGMENLHRELSRIFD
ncbi:MAG: tetraacyldisaccharide 4'-kinase [bacterium]|nr:tetraacyldisaccharide 4'-kinase [bacterium]